MGEFTLPNSTPECKVSYPEELSKDKILSFRAFKEWTERLQHALSLQSSKDHPFNSTPYKLRAINIQAVDLFGGGRIGFLKLKATITNDKDEFLPGAMFLRGASVAMMITLQPDDTPQSSETDKHVLLTVQPRAAAGSLAFTELPAGMLDEGSFAGAAAREIEEECDLTVAEHELVNMSALSAARMAPQSRYVGGGNAEEMVQAGMYPSAGGCDEFVPLFLCEKRVKRSELREWEGKLTGLREHGEKITLKLVKLEDLWKEGSRDAKALSALALYNGLKAEKTI